MESLSVRNEGDAFHANNDEQGQARSIERPYSAGTAFVDPGQGHVHTAFNRTSGVTVLYATFFQGPFQNRDCRRRGTDRLRSAQLSS